MAGFFPLFFKKYWSEGFSPTESTYILGTANSSVSFLLALSLPFLGAVADAGGKRKWFLGLFTLLGAGGSALLTLVGPGAWPWAIALYIIGTIGFSGALPFYDALLLNVARSNQLDRVSGLGYAMGYLGGGLLFLVNVLMYRQWGATGILASFMSVGIWWLFFSFPLFRFVREPKSQSQGSWTTAAQTGFQQLRHHLKLIRRERTLWLFLIGYLFYIDAVNTIVKMAVDFGLSIGLDPTDLIQALLLVQFVGFPAAVFFGHWGEKRSPISGIWICLVTYLGVTLFAYNLQTSFQFYLLAGVIGLVQGGIQALSRSYYARLTPASESAQYFAFFNMVGKFSAILGPFLVAQVGYSLNDSRSGLLVLVLFFMIGGWFFRLSHRQPQGPSLKSCYLFVILLGPLVLFPRHHAQAIEPSWHFQVLRSPHFEIIYRDTQEALAKKYLTAAERAREILVPIFEEGPGKTILVLMDDTDEPNGLAFFLPYPQITIFPVLPSSNTGLEEYGDWPLEMMLHEYTHILNMYPVHGIYRPLQWIFGNLIRPNALLPNWYLEGLALDFESRFSTHGRARSSWGDAAMRALTLSDKWDRENISTINETGLNSWPRGARPYLYGGWWWKSLIKSKGSESIQTLNQNFSRRLPFLLNGPIREVSGFTPSELFENSKAELSFTAESQLETIRASTSHAEMATTLDELGEVDTFALSPNGDRLALIVRSDQSQIFRIARRNDNGWELADSPRVEVFSVTRVSWRNSSEVVFDQIDRTDPYVLYRDLFNYNLEQKSLKQLTERARAVEPTASPDGRSIVFVRNADEGTGLAKFDFQSGQIQDLVKSRTLQKLSSPIVHANRRVDFVARDRRGQSILFSRMPNGKLKRHPIILKGDIIKLRPAPKGWLVISDQSGVRNAYYIKDGTQIAVSNSETALSLAEWEPGGGNVYFTEMTANGSKLRLLKRQRFHPTTVTSDALPPGPESSSKPIEMKRESFMPLAYLWPRYWIPFIFQAEGGYTFQGVTANADPIGRNEYALGASYDSISEDLSYNAEYMNRSTPLALQLFYSLNQTYLGASQIEIESKSAGLIGRTHWPFGHRFITWNLGGSWHETTTTIVRKRIGPMTALNFDFPKWHFRIQHQEFLEQDGYLDYGRTRADLGGTLSLASRHNIYINTRASWAPELPLNSVIALGERNLGGIYLVNLAGADFLTRGYPSGTFVGREALNANLEYVITGPELARGLGTFPLFFRQLDFAFFADAMSVDGAAYITAEEGYYSSDLAEFYTGTGGELRLHTTAAYHMPVSLTMGLYYGLNERTSGGFSTFLGLGLGDLGPIKKGLAKTP